MCISSRMKRSAGGSFEPLGSGEPWSEEVAAVESVAEARLLRRVCLGLDGLRSPENAIIVD